MPRWADAELQMFDDGDPTMLHTCNVTQHEGEEESAVSEERIRDLRGPETSNPTHQPPFCILPTYKSPAGHALHAW
jgi:hypothetical protein